MCSFSVVTCAALLCRAFAAVLTGLWGRGEGSACDFLVGREAPCSGHPVVSPTDATCLSVFTLEVSFGYSAMLTLSRELLGQGSWPRLWSRWWCSGDHEPHFYWLFFSCSQASGKSIQSCSWPTGKKCVLLSGLRPESQVGGEGSHLLVRP